mmetsp:Transcript_22970/g.50614  ORF Transcript_22970/g.50614 Transcript_22970/m.50614 type:complete len:326 (-) Transcript_22970:156-1133(-)
MCFLSICPEAGNCVEGDRTTCKPSLLSKQQMGFLLSHNQCSHSSRVPKELVEAHGDEIGLVLRKVEKIRGHEGSGVGHHQPPPLLSVGDPVQAVLDSGDVALQGEGEELLAGASLLGEGVGDHGRLEMWLRLGEVTSQDGARCSPVHVQGLRVQRQISHLCAPLQSLFSDTMHAVVVVGADGQGGARARLAEVEPLRDEAAGAAGIRGPNDFVLGGVRVHVRQDSLLGPKHPMSGHCGSLVGRVGVAQSEACLQLSSPHDMALPRLHSTSVVKIDLCFLLLSSFVVCGGIQLGEVRFPKRVQGRKIRILCNEPVIGLLHVLLGKI